MLSFSLRHLAAKAVFHRWTLVGPWPAPTPTTLFVSLSRHALDVCAYQALAPTYDLATHFDACATRVIRGGTQTIAQVSGNTPAEWRTQLHKLLTFLARAKHPVTVVPLAAHLDPTPGWQGNVELEQGNSFCLDTGSNPTTLTNKIVDSLTALNLLGLSAGQKQAVESLAYLAMLSGAAQYTPALHALEQLSSKELEEAQRWGKLENLILIQGLPLIPTKHVVSTAVQWVALSGLVLTSGLLNAPLVTALSQDTADGTPRWQHYRWQLTGFLGMALGTAGLTLLGSPSLAVAYVVLTLGGLKTFPRWKRLGILLNNAVHGSPHSAKLIENLSARLTDVLKKQS